MADCVSKQCYTGRPGHLLITIAINTHHCIRICIVYSRLKSIGHTTAAVHQYCTLCTVRRVLCPVYTYSIHYYVQLLLARVRRCLQLRLNFNSTALQPFSVLCYVPYNAIIIIIKVTCSFFSSSRCLLVVYIVRGLFINLPVCWDCCIDL